MFMGLINLPDLSALSRMRLGPGVIGRTSHVMVFALISGTVGIYTLKSEFWAVTSVLIGLFILIAGFLVAAFWYANKHPTAAIMDGADFVRHAEVIQAAKDPRIIDVTAKPVENVSAPDALKIEKRSHG